MRPHPTRRTVLALSLAVPGTAAPRVPGGLPAASAGQALHALLASAEEADLRLNPLEALARGDSRHEGRYGDHNSDDHLAAQQAEWRRRRQALGAIPRSALSETDRLAWDWFRHDTDHALDGVALGAWRWRQRMPLDPVFGAHLSFAQLASGEGQAPFATELDYQHGLTRMEGYVAYLERCIGHMRGAAREGFALPRVLVRQMIGQLQGLVDTATATSPYYAPLRRLPPALQGARGDAIAADYRRAIDDLVRPAHRRLVDFLEREYQGARRAQAPGVGALPHGAAYYDWCVREHCTLALPVDDIHRQGRDEVARITGAMEAIRRRMGFAGDLAAFKQHLRTDPRYKFDSAEALLNGYRQVARRVDAVLPAFVPALPMSRLEIRAVPPEQEGSAGGAYYVVGTPDGSRPGVFYVNTADLPTRTSLYLTGLYLHEGMPGHHLQGSLAQENLAAPALLRFGWNAGYGEGWALYCEFLGEEMGLYDDPIQAFGRLDMEMLRAVRLLLDTGLHVRGWSRERAQAELRRHTVLDETDVTQEVDRYLVWPGQAPAYKVGEREIRRLRALAQRQLGARFDLRAFHGAVLQGGAMPLQVLRRQVQAWVRRSSASPDSRTGRTTRS